MIQRSRRQKRPQTGLLPGVYFESEGIHGTCLAMNMAVNRQLFNFLPALVCDGRILVLLVNHKVASVLNFEDAKVGKLSGGTDLAIVPYKVAIDSHLIFQQNTKRLNLKWS